MTGRVLSWAAPVTLFVIAGIAILLARSYPGIEDALPGPATFPIVIASLLLILAVWTGASKAEADPSEAAPLRTVFFVILLLIAFVLGWSFVPFLLVGPAFVFALFILLGHRVVVSAVGTVLFTAALYLLLVVALGIRL